MCVCTHTCVHHCWACIALAGIPCVQALDHESMESLRTQDLNPIDLYKCFKAFVREDDLGDEECWSVLNFFLLPYLPVFRPALIRALALALATT